MDTRSRRAVLTVVGATTTEYANTFGTCWDLEGDGFTNPFIPLLMEDYKLDRWDCGSLSHLCSASDSSTVRMVCPETCGCDHPRSSLFLNGAAFGCPRVSCTAKDQYMVELENISCSTSNVQAPADWTDFVVHWDTHWAESGTSDGTVKSQLLAHGCDAVQSYQAIRCVETSASMGFSMWCPVQCGCRVPNGGYLDVPCPPSCDQWRSMYEESLADLPCEDAAAVDFISGSSSSLLSVHLTVYELPFFSGGCHYVVADDRIRLQCSSCEILWRLTHTRAVCPVICGLIFNSVSSADPQSHSQYAVSFPRHPFLWGPFFGCCHQRLRPMFCLESHLVCEKKQTRRRGGKLQ